AIPLLVAVIGWPLFVSWVAGPAPLPATPEAAGAAATSVATAGVAAAQPTIRPTVGAPPTVQAKSANVRPAATLVPAVAFTPESAEPESAETPASDPGAAVSSFYTLVSSHQFDSAAQLWSPRMRAAFPPDV